MADTPTLTSLIERIRARGNKDCLVTVCDGVLDTWSSERVADTALRLAKGLQSRGIGDEKVVMLWAPNSQAWVVTALAVNLAGGVLMPIDEQAREDGPRVVRDSGAVMIATDSDHARDLRAAGVSEHVEILLLDAREDGALFWEDLLADDAGGVPNIDADAPAILTFTSGTTGMPKSFTLSHANLLTNARNIRDGDIATADDRAMLPLPLHHSYPYVIGMLSPLMIGAPLIFPEAPTGPKIIEALRAGDVTILLGVPRLYNALINGLDANLDRRPLPVRSLFRNLERLSIWVQRQFNLPVGQILLLPLRKAMAPKIRLMVSGGAPLDPGINARLEALGWMVCSGYGLSETASVFSTNVPSARRIGSAGRVLGDGEVKIDSPDAEGIGEILVRGPSVFQGYRDNPEANRTAFTEDGWFRTGDLGYVDSDDYIFVTGRAKELIVLGGGKKINPEGVEKAYLEQPVIAEIGLFENNGALVAIIRPELEEIRRRGLTQLRQAISVAISEAAQHQTAHARPSGFQLTNEPLPRTRLGKIRRFMLPELYNTIEKGSISKTEIHLTESDKELLRNPKVSHAYEFLKKRYPQQTVGPDTDLQLDLGIDSFGWMTISLELQEGAGVVLSDEAIASMQSVRDLMTAVDASNDQAGTVQSLATPEGVNLDPEHWLRPTSPPMTLLGVTSHKLVQALMRFYFSLEAQGIDNIPKNGPIILAPNHVSDLDPIAVAASLPTARLKQTYWAGDINRLFGNKAWRFLSRLAHVFPVDERRPTTAIDAAETVLKNGKTQIWFPEGWRSPDGTLQRFMPGIGKVLRDTSSQALPVLIEGAFEAMPRGQRWPKRHPIKVTYGKPVSHEQLLKEGQGASAEEKIADGIRSRIAEMAGYAKREAA